MFIGLRILVHLQNPRKQCLFSTVLLPIKYKELNRMFFIKPRELNQYQEKPIIKHLVLVRAKDSNPFPLPSSVPLSMQYHSVLLSIQVILKFLSIIIPPLICPLVHIADIEIEVKVVTKAESKMITDDKPIPA